jgi:HEAT repeat protein
MNWKIGIMLLAIGLVDGCYSPDPPSLSSDSAPIAIPAIKAAAKDDNRHAIPRLIEFLESHDSAIRFSAISALKHLTGEDLGYRYYDSEAARRPAIARWKLWLKEHPQ